MRKRLAVVLPIIIMPIFIPVYIILDNFILVDIFGCGCVPSTQTNMLNMPFNANDLRTAVFSALTMGLFIWSVIIAKTFKRKIVKIVYCFTVILLDVILTLWVINAFMWA